MPRSAAKSRRIAEPALKSRAAPAISAGMKARDAKFAIGQVVKHRVFPFRGVIFDVDPEFNNTEEWWLAIPEEIRPRKDQPFYHLLAENAETEYVAYVSEQNLLPDTSGEPLRHPHDRRHVRRRTRPAPIGCGSSRELTPASD